MVPASLDSSKNVMVGLAREIAMGMQEIGVILQNYKLTTPEWERIQRDPRFAELLQACVVEWNSAVNTEQRIKYKSAVMLEEWLPEAHGRLHDKNENLSAKVELAKFLGRLNDLGLGTGKVVGEQGEKFSITINLGADREQVKFEKVVAPKVIEHEGE